jgi:16S rRNA (adenine1518-N6/adenine1519-N6)-dimethyltransferase
VARIKKEERQLAHHGALSPRAALRPKKKLGQHFLVDEGIIEKIIASSRFQPSDIVLEIGPGQGALTLPLSKTVSHVIAVEKDIRFANLLQEKLSNLGISNVTLVNHDILTFDFNGIKPRPSGKIQIIGNIPYNISSPLLGKVIKNRKIVARAILMFQLEVARRLTSVPCTKAYGAMTLQVQYHARSTCLVAVSKKAFYPVPKVDSMVVEIDMERPYPSQGVHNDHFRKVVKGAFAHRRKTIVNSMKGFFPSWTSGMLMDGMNACGIDPKRRAETLNMDEFLCLTSALAIDKRETG